MKNSCLRDERWNPNDNDIRKNITNMVFDADDVRAGFENHDSSPCFSNPCESWSESAQNFFVLAISKSRLVSRLRFFFLHLMMTPNDDNFFIRAKMSRMPIKPEYPFHFYLHLPELLTTLRVRFSDENPSFSVSFL